MPLEDPSEAVETIGRVSEEKHRPDTAEGCFGFGLYRLDIRRRVLLHSGDDVQLSSTQFNILIALVQRAGEIVSKADLLDSVWRNKDIQEDNVTREVSYLRDRLRGGRREFIDTVHGHGYRFVKPVVRCDDITSNEHASHSFVSVPPSLPIELAEMHRVLAAGTTQRYIATGMTFMLLLYGTYIASSVIRRTHASSGDTTVSSSTDEAAVRRVVEESQLYEMLNLYEHPKTFRKEDLDRYFVSEEDGGQAVQNIRASVQRLITNQWHYGPASRREAFDVLQISIQPSGDYATVRTREHWYLPILDEDGTPIIRADRSKGPSFGPYELTYTLRKLRGRWLIQFCTTPYSK